jgi:hypothetical protein
MIELLFLAAPFGVVPLALRLLEAPRPLRLAVWPLAILAAASFAVPKGPWAGALAAPWAAFSALGALWGLTRLRRELPRLLETAGLLLWPVGGAHLIASRLGMEVLGFREPIVLLTAVHFHYTGLALPVLAARSADRTPWPRLHLASALAAVGGTPLLAVGFLYSRPLQLAAAWLVSLGVWGLAASQLGCRPRLRDLTARDLLAMSSASAGAGMALAAIYALGEFLHRDWLPIPTMAAGHGVLNGLGFVLGGLWAWATELSRSKRFGS